MPFPGLHKYLSISGLLRGSETWSIGLRMETDGFDGDQAAEEATLDDIRLAIESWWGTNQIIGNAATITTLKYNSIGADGKYFMPYTVRHDYSTPFASQVASSHPNQIALVATLETGLTRGLAHRGRLFLPAPTNPVGTDGRVSQANTVAAAASVKVLLDRINAVGNAGRIVVGSSVGAGAFRDVTAVSVGRVLDTMRSRRTSLDEGRETAALAAVV